MKNLKSYSIKLLLILLLILLSFNRNPEATVKYDQDVTCYVANPNMEFPSQQGYSYVLCTTGASHLSIRGNYSSSSKTPYGTRVTFNTPVHIYGYGNIS